VWNQVQGQSLFPADLRWETKRLAIAEYLEPQPSLPALRKRFPGFDGSHYDRALRIVRTSDTKYIWASDGRDEFYDLSNDPQEEHNLITTEAERASQLRVSLEKWLGSFKHADQCGEDADLDQLTIKRLEELGYLA
jgi:hypothetical protein